MEEITNKLCTPNLQIILFVLSLIQIFSVAAAVGFEFAFSKWVQTTIGQLLTVFYFVYCFYDVVCRSYGSDCTCIDTYYDAETNSNYGISYVIVIFLAMIVKNNKCIQMSIFYSTCLHLLVYMITSYYYEIRSEDMEFCDGTIILVEWRVTIIYIIIILISQYVDYMLKKKDDERAGGDDDGDDDLKKKLLDSFHYTIL